MPSFAMTPMRLVGLLASSPSPSAHLDALLVSWNGGAAHAAPTSSIEAADAFCTARFPRLTYIARIVADRVPRVTVMSLDDRPCCVSASGSTQALALLSAFVAAVEAKKLSVAGP